MRQPTVLIASRDAPDYQHHLEALGLAPSCLVALPEAEPWPDRAREATVALGEPDRLAMVAARLPQLAWVQSTWAGLTPLLHLAKGGLTVTGVKGVFGAQMAEYALGHMLSHALDLPTRRAAQAEGRWLDRPTGTLAGRTLGVMGTGSIGREVAQRAAALGMTPIGYSRSGTAQAPFERVFDAKHLIPFLSACEYLLAVLPDTPATADLMDATAFAALPRGALFINVGRGSLVVDQDLVAALECNHLGGAVLDVFREEPLPGDHPFWRTPRLDITAHIAARSWPRDIAALFADNHRRYLAGQPLKHRLDPDKGY